MLTLIRNAEVYSPEPLGRRDVLLAGGRIAAIDKRISLTGDMVEEVDAHGMWLLPGFVDPLTHPAGGGGEGVDLGHHHLRHLLHQVHHVGTDLEEALGVGK